jgi:hypothetical protein
MEQSLVLGVPPLPFENVWPLIFLIFFLISVWFTLVRPLQKWLYTHGRYSAEEQRQYWLGVQANGREKFVWRFGVLRWGLSAFAISTSLMLAFDLRGYQPSAYAIAAVLVCLAIWTLGGYWFGGHVWERLSKKHESFARNPHTINNPEED